MAEVDVQRRGPSIWPWIVGLLALVLVIWLAVELLGDDDDDDVVVEQTALAPGPTSGARTFGPPFV